MPCVKHLWGRNASFNKRSALWQLSLYFARYIKSSNLKQTMERIIGQGSELLCLHSFYSLKYNLLRGKESAVVSIGGDMRK